MNLADRISSIILTATLLSGAAAAQSPGDGVPRRSADAFAIETGASFSASSPGSRTISKPEPRKSDLVESDFAEALRIIRDQHVAGSSTDVDKIASQALKGMLRALDPHSTYYNPAEFAALLGEHNSEYSGTGSTIINFRRGNSLETYVVGVRPGSPAAQAGLNFGDRIVAVDGRAMSGRSSLDVRNMVRGKHGSTVTLKIERAATGHIEDLVIKRDKVPQPSVPYAFLVDDKVGYIAMTGGFTYSTFVEFETALNNLKAAGAQSLVLDLRGNTGGIFDTAVEVAEKFLPAGTDIVTQRGRYPYLDRKWRSANKNPETMPLVLLVDGNTASASEILAAALQDNDRAIIVGEKTFGKGLVQNVLDLPDGSGLTLTAARYYTPSGRSIQRDYSDSGLYEYFTQTNRAELIEKAEYAARTATGRKVYGGDGIAPDREASPRNVFGADDRVIDEAFHFAVAKLRSSSFRESVRQDVIFSRPVVDEGLLGEFLAKLPAPSAPSAEAAQGQLAYFLALGAFGDEAAAAQQIIADPVVTAAIEEFPRARTLARAAQAARKH